MVWRWYMHVLSATVFQAAWLQACPLCVGRVQKDSPPFFSDAFYQPTAEKVDLEGKKPPHETPPTPKEPSHE